ncbi:hypothetical protein QE399_002302 [Paracidovorax wautersii]|uniref:Uncharacterized protein n=1 Tax=Paracidovorax wautersii TaxID=1177982 RepID=A0ABU1IDG3_9BURK|nr:hypothetical protein [Paracidovorax wautersii]
MLPSIAPPAVAALRRSRLRRLSRSSTRVENDGLLVEL